MTWQFHAFCQGLTAVEQQGWFPQGVDAEQMWRDALGAFVAGLATDASRSPVRGPTPITSRPAKPKRR